MSGTTEHHDAALANLPAIERQALAAIYGKLMRKEKLTRKEQSTLSRFERDREERLRWQYYETIPKKHWQRMSGRQVKVINEQAARYGLPIGGPTIDLAAFIPAFHDFLARNSQKLAQEEDELLRSGHASPALEWYRRERARLARLDRRAREGELISWREFDYVVRELTDLVRGAGERLYRDYGKEVGDVLVDALHEGERRYEASFKEAKAKTRRDRRQGRDRRRNGT